MCNSDSTLDERDELTHAEKSGTAHAAGPAAAPMMEAKQSRYWTQAEHERFLQARVKFGEKNYVCIADYVGTRSAKQVRTHAQKYVKRLEREAARRQAGVLYAARDAERRDEVTAQRPPISAANAPLPGIGQPQESKPTEPKAEHEELTIGAAMAGGASVVVGAPVAASVGGTGASYSNTCTRVAG